MIRVFYSCTIVMTLRPRVVLASAPVGNALSGFVHGVQGALFPPLAVCWTAKIAAFLWCKAYYLHPQTTVFMQVKPINVLYDVCLVGTPVSQRN